MVVDSCESYLELPERERLDAKADALDGDDVVWCWT